VNNCGSQIFKTGEYSAVIMHPEKMIRITRTSLYPVKHEANWWKELRVKVTDSNTIIVVDKSVCFENFCRILTSYLQSNFTYRNGCFLAVHKLLQIYSISYSYATKADKTGHQSHVMLRDNELKHKTSCCRTQTLKETSKKKYKCLKSPFLEGQ